MGYESLSEFIVSKLLNKSNVKDYINYELIRIKYDNKEVTGCSSRNFRNKNEMLIPIEKLHRQYFGYGLATTLAKIDSVEKRIDYTVSFLEDKTALKDIGKYFSLMLAIDTFFLNEDRHTNNIAVIRNENTKTFRMAPIFDNGLSLLSDVNDYPIDKDVYSNIKLVKAKPFDTSFDEQLDAAEKLYGCNLKFSFDKADVYALIDSIKGLYDAHIINRVERIILEQMRKYSFLFD